MKELKKTKVLFDATIIASAADTGFCRSGIFFTALNLLTMFYNHPDIDVALYCAPDRIKDIKIIFEKEFPQFTHLEPINECEHLQAYEIKKTLKKQKEEAVQNGDKAAKKAAQAKLNLINLKIGIQELLTPRSQTFKDFDVFFSPVFAPPRHIRQDNSVKKFVMLYDAMPIILSGYKVKGWFKDLINSIDKQTQYFSISEYTRQDFLKLLPKFKPEQIKTTLLAASDKFYHCEDKEQLNKIQKKYSIPENKKYIFSLSTLDPRKNLVFAIKNFLQFIEKNNVDDLVFLLGGGHWDKVMSEVDKHIASLKPELREKVIKLGYVDDADLSTLYSNSHFFVFPSTYEGFGLPVLESMQCKCAVITSNVTSIPEVAGDAAILINPEKDEELIAAFEKLYFDDDFRKNLAQKGFEHVKQFSWEKCASLMIKEFKNNKRKAYPDIY